MLINIIIFLIILLGSSHWPLIDLYLFKSYFNDYNTLYVCVLFWWVKLKIIQLYSICINLVFTTVTGLLNYTSLNFNSSLIYGVKFIITLLFLIFIRAGIPRYRYDYLTILGWNRFLFFCLFILISLLILYFLC